MMEEVEFNRLLAQYPIVRKRTHSRVQWNALANENEQLNKRNRRIISNDDVTKNIYENDTFQLAINKFLSSYYSPNEIQRIQEELNKSQTNLLSSLCLEDINDISRQFLQ